MAARASSEVSRAPHTQGGRWGGVGRRWWFGGGELVTSRHLCRYGTAPPRRVCYRRPTPAVVGGGWAAPHGAPAHGHASGRARTGRTAEGVGVSGGKTAQTRLFPTINAAGTECDGGLSPNGTVGVLAAAAAARPPPTRRAPRGVAGRGPTDRGRQGRGTVGNTTLLSEIAAPRRQTPRCSRGTPVPPRLRPVSPHLGASQSQFAASQHPEFII